MVGHVPSFAAWRNVQLHDDDVAEVQGFGDVDERAPHLRVLLDAYGLPKEDRPSFVTQIAELAVHDARCCATRCGPPQHRPSDATLVRMGTAAWPLSGLNLKTDRLEMRLPTDEELFELVAMVPDDLETDPTWPAPPGAAHPTATAVLQWYWRALGEWKLDHWRLPMAVWFESRLVGFQELEAERFSALATVESSSWLVTNARGLGVGKEMRAAILNLAFEHLGAEIATSGAWESNTSSLGVSRALGYTDNGWFVHDHLGRIGRQRRVILERAQWDGSRWPTAVAGLDACRAWFGAPRVASWGGDS